MIETYIKSFELDSYNILSLHQLAMIYEKQSREKEAKELRKKMDIINMR